MKVLLMSMNSKFIHSNLSLYYLKEYAFKQRALFSNVTLDVKEYTINMNLDDVLMSLASGNYDVIFASAYIWNIEPYDILFKNLKLIKPTVKVVFGGPEVTYNPEHQLLEKAYLDAVIVGEGEVTFLETLKQISDLKRVQFNDVNGIVFKTEEGFIHHNPIRDLIQNLDDIPFPYADLEAFDNKIIYYETTRGCPYNCSYCLSSALQGVRYFSHEKVFKDLKIFMDAKVPQVKFVDRTFNVSKKHAIPIMEYLIQNDNGITNFHFEITADLMDEDYIKVVEKSRKGLFQFEIGVQSTCEEALKAINRPIRFEKVKTNTQKLIATGKAHTHVDLIAGLPGEGYNRFMQSFDDVFGIGADHLQLGFLKLLKGTPLHQTADQYGYKIRCQSPYEILENSHITFDEISRLKKIEMLLEYYWNSEKFVYTMRYLLENVTESSSRFFERMSYFWDEHQYFESAVGTFRLYEILDAFSKTLSLDSDLINDLLKMDYYKSRQKGMKTLFAYEDDEKFNAKRLLLLSDESFVNQYLPQYQSISAKQILKSVAFVSVRYDMNLLVTEGFKQTQRKSYVVVIDQDTDMPFEEIVQVPIDYWEDL